jgi:hypothetical protein
MSDPPAVPKGMRLRDFSAGYERAINDVLWMLQFEDWQEDTAAEAVRARFGQSTDSAPDDRSGR